MASETLQTAIQYTYYLCELYEKNGERILGNQQPLAEFAGFAYYKYLLYLANLDRQLEETEVQYLNDLLHYNMTLSQLQTFCKRHPFTAESVQDTLRGLLDLWIRVDLAEQGDSSLSLFFLNLLNLMGLSFTADTNQRDERQASAIAAILLPLRIESCKAGGALQKKSLLQFRVAGNQQCQLLPKSRKQHRKNPPPKHQKHQKSVRWRCVWKSWKA